MRFLLILLISFCLITPSKFRLEAKESKTQETKTKSKSKEKSTKKTTAKSTEKPKEKSSKKSQADKKSSAKTAQKNQKTPASKDLKSAATKDKTTKEKKLEKNTANIVEKTAKAAALIASNQTSATKEEEKKSTESNYVSGNIDADYYFLFDPDGKEVLLAKNADLQIPPSSMTKVMTAYVVFDQVKKGKISLSSQCLVGKDAWRKSGSSMFLNYGDLVTIDELVQGLLAVSGNDAAIALAESTAGGIEKFIDMMNQTAQELGLKNSHFKNPHGLYEPDHYMSVRDIATLAAAFLENFPEYTSYLGIEEFRYGKVKQLNRNPLIKQHYEGTIGGKTGHTNQGGYGVVGIVKRNNRTLIAVVNKAKTPPQRSKAITQLFDYGFKQFKKFSIFANQQEIAKLNTWLGDKAQVSVITNQEISLNIPARFSSDDIKVKVEYVGPVFTPIQKNAQIANLVVEVKNYRKFTYPLFAKEAVEKANYFQRLKQIIAYKLS